MTQSEEDWLYLLLLDSSDFKLGLQAPRPEISVDGFFQSGISTLSAWVGRSGMTGSFVVVVTRKWKRELFYLIAERSPNVA